LVTINKVKKEEEKILHNIMQFYFYEFSKYIPQIKLEQNGIYKPFDLDKYWEKENYHAFFIMQNEEYIGFALIESSTETSPNSVKEFFILEQHKGKGYGKKVAIELFNKFPGTWRITQIEKNKPAKAFWRSIINDYTNGNFTETFDYNKKQFKNSIR
jgi:predicted acetyltransferase